MRGLILQDTAFIAPKGSNMPGDDFESYTTGCCFDGSAGGYGWLSPWHDRQQYMGVQAAADFEPVVYVVGEDLSGKGAETGFSATWTDREQFLGVKGFDDFESYADETALVTDNDGFGFTFAWVSHSST